MEVLEAKTNDKRVVIQLSLLKKTKTTQNIDQLKHLTDLLTTDIKESRNTRKNTLQETSCFTRQFD